MVDTNLDNTLGSALIGEALPLLVIGSPAAHYRCLDLRNHSGSMVGSSFDELCDTEFSDADSQH